MLRIFPLKFANGRRTVHSRELQLEVCYYGICEWFELPKAYKIDEIWLTVSDSYAEIFDYFGRTMPKSSPADYKVKFCFSDFLDELLFERKDCSFEPGGFFLSGELRRLIPGQGGYFLLEYTEK